MNGKINTFKPGSALLSLQANIPVLPIHISGTYKLWPKGQLLPKPGKLQITVGKPIFPPAHKRIKQEMLQSLTTQYEQALKSLGKNSKFFL